MLKWTRESSQAFILLLVMIAICAGAPSAFPQASISAGNIVGTVADESSAIVPGAKITVINKATGSQLSLTTNSSGIYNSGPLTPGEYTVRVEASGFSATETTLPCR